MLSVDQKIALLVEQSKFLIEKQKEARDEGRTLFEDLVFFIENKIEKEKDAKNLEDLKSVREMFIAQAEDTQEAMSDDIGFLSEQSASLIELRDNVTDQDKKKELLYLMINEDDELGELEQFKLDVSREAASSKAHLSAMIEDFKDALSEGNIQEVKLHLQAALEGDDDADEEGELDCGSCSGCGTGDGCGAPLEDEDIESELEQKSCACGKQQSCGCSGGSCGKGTDIFSALDDILNVLKYHK